MKYKAFISYNSKDNSTARWLQSKLENYSLPSLIVNEKGDVLRSYDRKPKKFRIFRYVTDLVAQNLDDGLRQELDQSEYLVVICSPNSANAPWVKEEVKYFIETGRKKKIIPFVIEGMPYSGDEEECFTKELKDAFPNGSVLGVSLNDYGDDLWIFRRRKAVAKIVSLLIDLPNAFDFIWNRYRRIFVAKVSSIITSLLLFIFLFYVFALPVKLDIILMEKNYLLPRSDDAEIIINSSHYPVHAKDTSLIVYLPGYYRIKPYNLNFYSKYYRSISLSKRAKWTFSNIIKLNLDRDDTFAIYAGTVIDQDREPLSGVCVVVADEYIVYTNEAGKYRIALPLEKQDTIHKLEISKEGYIAITKNEIPSDGATFVLIKNKL